MTAEAAQAEDTSGAARPGRRRVSSFGVFWLAFLLLVAAVAAIAFAQFRASHAAPWVSMGLSGAAIVFTIVAVVVHDH